MKIKIEKIDNPSQLNIESVEVHNDNNYSFKAAEDKVNELYLGET